MKQLKLPTDKKRNAVTLALVLALTAVVLAVSLTLPLAMHRFNWYPDLTLEGLYTLSDALKEELSTLEEDVEIIFCADPDYVFASDELRLPYVTCKRLAEGNEHITVRCINLTNDPSAVDEYKTTEGSVLSWDSVIFAAGGRYKILSGSSFYGTEDGEVVSYNGEYRIATTVLSLTAYKDGPLACFAVGHGERYYLPNDAGSDPELSAFYEMLLDLGMRVGKLDIDSVDAVPEDCALLIMCEPTEDYNDVSIMDYDKVSALDKLDRFLSARNALMVFRGASCEALPALEEYLEEWGIRFDRSLVTSKENSLSSQLGESEGERVISVYPVGDDAPLGYTMLSSIIDMPTPPKTVTAHATSIRSAWKEETVTIAQNTSRYVNAVLFAPDDAEAKDAGGYTVSPDKSGRLWLSAISTEARLKDGEYRYSYVFAGGSTEMIENRYLADAAYGNGDVLFSVMRHIARADVFASDAVGSADPNDDTYGGKIYADTDLSSVIYSYDKNGNEVKSNTTHAVYDSLTDYTMYRSLYKGTKAFVLILTTVLPTLAVAVCAFIVLRKRRHR